MQVDEEKPCALGLTCEILRLLRGCFPLQTSCLSALARENNWLFSNPGVPQFSGLINSQEQREAEKATESKKISPTILLPTEESSPLLVLKELI